MPLPVSIWLTSFCYVATKQHRQLSDRDQVAVIQSQQQIDRSTKMCCFIKPRRMHHVAYCDRWSRRAVYHSVNMSVTRLRCAKTAGQIEVLLRVEILGDIVTVDGGFDSPMAIARNSMRPSPNYFVFLFSDLYDWPQPTCQFPDWLRAVTWRDVTGKWRYSVSHHGNVINAYYQPSSIDKPRLSSKFRCVRTLDFYILEEEFIYLSFSTHEWCSVFISMCIGRRAVFLSGPRSWQ